MPKKFPPEFKRDVVIIARRGQIPIPEVAADFDISETKRHFGAGCARPTFGVATV